MESPWVVLDTGSYRTRAGMGGFTTPAIVSPTLIEELPSGALSSWTPRIPLFGFRAEEEYDILPIKEPVQGHVSNWSNWMDFTHAVLAEQLGVDLSEHRLMNIEQVSTPVANREKAMQIAFEEWEMRGYFVASSVACAGFALSAPTCAIIDIGHQNSVVTCIGDGWELPHLRRQLKIHGKAVEESLDNYLTQRGIHIHCHSKQQYRTQLRLLKEHYATLKSPTDAISSATDAQPSKIESSHCPSSSSSASHPRFDLRRADGTPFDPSEIDWSLLRSGLCTTTDDRSTVQPILQLIREEKKFADTLPGNIFLIGAGAQIPGLAEELQRQLKQARDLPWVVRVAPNPDVITWKGASMLTSDPYINKMVVTYAEYDENGPAFVHRRCF